MKKIANEIEFKKQAIDVSPFVIFPQPDGLYMGFIKSENMIGKTEQELENMPPNLVIKMSPFVAPLFIVPFMSIFKGFDIKYLEEMNKLKEQSKS